MGALGADPRVVFNVTGIGVRGLRDIRFRARPGRRGCARGGLRRGSRTTGLKWTRAMGEACAVSAVVRAGAGLSPGCAPCGGAGHGAGAGVAGGADGGSEPGDLGRRLAQRSCDFRGGGHGVGRPGGGVGRRHSAAARRVVSRRGRRGCGVRDPSGEQLVGGDERRMSVPDEGRVGPRSRARGREPGAGRSLCSRSGGAVP